MKTIKLAAMTLLAAALFSPATHADAAVPFTATETDTDGTPVESTVWYTMQIGNSGLVMADNGSASSMTLAETECTFTPSELWAFVGSEADGYTIYNMAAPGKMLASPKTMSGTTGSTAYVVMKEPGDSNYEYKWDFAPSTDINNSWYLSQHGKSGNAVNNRNGKLAFWTAGKDHGSSVVVKFGRKVMTLDLSTGALHRTNITGETGQNWNAAWVSQATAPQLAFVNAANNMTAADGCIAAAVGQQKGAYTFSVPDMEYCYVSAFEFDFANNGHSDAITVTCGDKTMTSGTAVQHFAADGFSYSSQPSINLDGPNKTIRMSNFKATVSRAEAVPQGVIVMLSESGKVPYRIPAIAIVGNGDKAGRLVAISDYRFSGDDIGRGSGMIDLHCSVSDDNGATWTTPSVIKDADGNPVAKSTGDKTAFDCGFGDPCIVGDRETGKLLMMSCAGYGGFFGSTRQAPQRVARWYSEDGGDTWTEAQDITEHIYGAFDNIPNGYGPVEGMFFGSGRIMQSAHVKVGDYYRLYAVMSGRESNGIANWVMYSDDFGGTWAILGDPAVPPVPDTADEPKAEELPDGSVVLSARVNGGTGRHFNIYRYTDAAKAEGWWDQRVRVNIRNKATTYCNGEILIMPAKNTATGERTYLALQSVPFGPARANVGIFWKVLDNYDDMGTSQLLADNWDGEKQISFKSSAYSTMVPDKEGNVAFLFEEVRNASNYYCTVFQSISLNYLTDGAYTATEPDTDLSVANAIAGRMIEGRVNALEGRISDTDMNSLRALADAFAAAPSLEAMDAYNTFEARLFQMIKDVDAARAAVEGGKYVGQLYGKCLDDLKAAIEAYDAAPGLDTYTAISAVLDNAVYLIITDGGQYRIWNFAREADGMVASNASDKLKAGAKSRATRTMSLFTFHAADEPGKWLIECEGKFLASSPAVENVFEFVEREDAGAYIVNSRTDGVSAIISATPANGTYPAWHLSADKSRIVPWTASADASAWYIAPEDPENSVSGVESVSTDNNASADVVWFDIYGRRVAALKPGHLYIGSDGSKQIAR